MSENKNLADLGLTATEITMIETSERKIAHALRVSTAATVLAHTIRVPPAATKDDRSACRWALGLADTLIDEAEHA